MKVKKVSEKKIRKDVVAIFIVLVLAVSFAYVQKTNNEQEEHNEISGFMTGSTAKIDPYPDRSNSRLECPDNTFRVGDEGPQKCEDVKGGDRRKAQIDACAKSKKVALEKCVAKESCIETCGIDSQCKDDKDEDKKCQMDDGESSCDANSCSEIIIPIGSPDKPSKICCIVTCYEKCKCAKACA